MKVAKYIFIISAISVLIFSIVNCDGGEGHCEGYNSEPQYFDIPPLDTMKIFYQGNERLKFQVTVNNKIVDTIIFKGKGKTKTFEKFFPPDAPGYCVNYFGESQTIEFENIDYNSEWGNMTYWYYFIGSGVTKLQTTLRDITFYGSVFSLNDQTWGGYIKDTVFNGVQYNNVTMFTDDGYKDITKAENEPIIFHTSYKGIVRIKVNNSEYWDLIP
jgi:hypothetical protein